MREQELNTLFNIVKDPDKNVYQLKGRKEINEIQRMVRIFNINEEQKKEHALLSLNNIDVLNLVMSNN